MKKYDFITIEKQFLKKSTLLIVKYLEMCVYVCVNMFIFNYIFKESFLNNFLLRRASLRGTPYIKRCILAQELALN